jgi:hypothetical protein
MNKHLVISDNNHTFFYEPSGHMTEETPDTVYLLTSSIIRVDYINDSIDENWKYKYGVAIYSVDGSKITQFFETEKLAKEYLNSLLH